MRIQRTEQLEAEDNPSSVSLWERSLRPDPAAVEIRPEYLRMADDFRILVHGWGIDFPEDAWRDLDRVMTACECLDRAVDTLGEKSQRAAAAEYIVACLGSGKVNPEPDGIEMPGDLACHLGELAPVLAKHLISRRFADDVARIYEASERARSAVNRRDLIDAVCDEGRGFLNLFVPIIEPQSPPKFMAFFRRLAAVGSLVDSLVDARADFRRGERTFQPSAWHHLRILLEIARQAPGVFTAYPRRLVLLRWALPYFWPANHRSACIDDVAKLRQSTSNE